MSYKSWHWHQDAGDIADLPDYPNLRMSNRHPKEVLKEYISQRTSYASSRLLRVLGSQ